MLASQNSAVFADEIEEVGLLDFGDEETVSIATGTAKSTRLAPSVASLITADDIARMGAVSLDDVLATVPGVYVTRGNGRNSATYSIRGQTSSANAEVLMMIDGIPVKQLFTGGRPNNFDMPVNNISRIEVIRGPGSAVFGADAFAGVINIITWNAGNADEVATNLGVRGGSFSTIDSWFQHTGKVGEWKLSTSLEYTTTDGDDDRRLENDLQTLLDQAFGTSASNAPGAINSSYDLLTFNLRAKNGGWNLGVFSWNMTDAGNGPGLSYALDNRGSSDISLLQLDASKKIDLSEDSKLKVGAYYTRHKEEDLFVTFPAGATVLIGDDGNLFTPRTPGTGSGLVNFPDGVLAAPENLDESFSADIVYEKQFGAAHALRMSFGYQREQSEYAERKNFGPSVIDGSVAVVDGTLTDVTGTPFVFSPDIERNIWHASIQDEWNVATDWMITYGLRYDNYSDFGGTLNPRLAVVWLTSYSLTSKLLYGRAFRAPSFGEQFAVNNPSVLGNPNLEPETVDTVELSFDYRPIDSFKVRTGIYSYWVKDGIEFLEQENNPSVLAAANAFDQQGRGLEVEMSWSISDTLNLSANYALQDQERDASTNVPNSAGHLFNLQLDTQLSDWFFNMQLNVNSKVARSSTDTRDELNSETTLNLTARRRLIGQRLEMAFLLKNALDEKRYAPGQEIFNLDVPLAGRAAFIELRYRFDN